MKKWLINWLGLNNLALSVETLKKENAEMREVIAQVSTDLSETSEKLDEIEIPDMDDYILERDFDYKVSDWLSNSDYCDYDRVRETVDEQIEELDIDEKVRDLFNDASPAPMTEDEIKKEVSEAVKITLEKVVKAIADNA